MSYLTRPWGMPLPLQPGWLQYLRAASVAARLEIAAMALLWAAALTLASQMLQPFTPLYSLAPGSVILALIAVYAGVALARGHLGLLVGMGLYVAALGFECLLFSLHAGARVNLNAALPQLLVLALVVFRECRLPLGLVLRIVGLACVTYLLVYVALTPLLLHAAPHGSALLLSASGGRGPRVYLVFEAAYFVAVYGCLRLRRQPFSGIALTGLAGVAIAMAGSRVLTLTGAVLLPLAVLSYALIGTRRPLLLAISVGFLAMVVRSLAGFALPEFNPYAILRGDDSGRARMLEFADARAAQHGHILFGVGLPPEPAVLNHYVQSSRPFYASDLGAAGVFFSFGIVGTVVFVGWSLLCIHATPWPLARRTAASQALAWTAVASAAVGWFAPAVLISLGAMFAAAVVGLWLKRPIVGRGRAVPEEAVDLDPQAVRLRD